MWHRFQFSTPYPKCVTLGIIGILFDLFGLRFCFLAFVKAGGPWTLGWHGPTKTHPSCRENVPAWCTWAHYKTQLVATLFPLLSANAAAVTHGTVVRSIGIFFWSCWPPETFETSAGWTSSSLLSFLTLGRRVAPLSVQYTLS